MINVGHNYGRNVKCPICKVGKEDDTQEHMFNGFILKLKCPELYKTNEKNYEDIFSLNENKLIKVARICESVIRKKEELFF